MFLNVSKVKYGNKVYSYLRILESYCHKGRIKKRLIANLGQLSLIDKDSLYRLGTSLMEFSGRKVPSLRNLQAISALHYGDVIAVKALWDSLHLHDIVKNTLSPEKRIRFNYPLCVFIMLINRLIAPKSKLGITTWQNKIYTEDTSSPQYQHFLRTLDYLAQCKNDIEDSLFIRLTDLFSLKLNLIFYDLTSTYFEGGSCPLASFGYSRDRRPDKKQIVLGLLVTDEGVPIAHEVYSGNIADKTTLKKTIDTLKRRFQIRHCIFVGDRGLVSEENLNYLSEEGYPFIVALRKRNLREVADLIKNAPCKYKIISDTLHLKEIKINEMRYLICRNPQKQRDDKTFRDNLIKEVTSSLKRLLNDAQSNLRRAAEILAKKRAKRYFTIGIDKGNKFFYHLKEQVIRYEEGIDGIYILKTNVLDIEAAEVVKAYKNLCEVESAFREIKDFLKLRPIYHYTPMRVRGHVMICVVSYLIEKLLEKSLRQAGLGISARVALEHLDTLRLVENKLSGQRILCVTTPSREHRQILKAVGITEIPKILKT